MGHEILVFFNLYVAAEKVYYSMNTFLTNQRAGIAFYFKTLNKVPECPLAWVRALTLIPNAPFLIPVNVKAAPATVSSAKINFYPL